MRRSRSEARKGDGRVQAVLAVQAVTIALGLTEIKVSSFEEIQ